MANTFPFAQAKATAKPAAKKGAAKKPMSAKQAQLVANFVKSKKTAPTAPTAAAMPMDPEDMIDGGVDEAKERD